MSDLSDDLQDIDGVGEVTAENIIEVLEDADTNDAVAENVEAAYEYYEAGQESYAGKFIKRAYEHL